MSLRWPCTVRGWVELVAIAGGLLGAAGTGLWHLHHANAYASDVRVVEERVTQGLDAFIEAQESKRCTTWLSEISFLEIRQASDELTDGQRDRLVWLRNQYEAECGRRNGS